MGPGSLIWVIPAYRFTDTRWEYGITSWVRFQNDRVIDWNDTDYDKLNARLEP